MKRVVIIGAGPAGSTTALHLAKAGYDVSVCEEHNIVGEPVQCTGIVTQELFKHVNKNPEFIINELKGVRAVAPNGTVAEIPLEETVICRKKFDKYLIRKAEKAGAKIYTNHKFEYAKDNVAYFNNNQSLPFDILIGADGPFSTVGRTSGLTKEREWWIGNQATVKGKFDPDWFITHFGSVCPGFFGWAVPEDRHYARIGVASKKFAGKYFDLLRKHYPGEITDRQAGPIPVYDGAKHVQKENIYLVGDAAGMCKNTTGGGIITGMWCAEVLADAIINNKNYSKQLAPLRKELWLHKKMRNMLDKFTDEDYNKLIKYMSSKKVKDILHNHPREYPSKFVWKLAVAEPRLLRFAKYMFA